MTTTTPSCWFQLLPAIRSIADAVCIIQEDNAPARPNNGARLLHRETTEFTAPDVWPPNSLDINRIDYRIWGVIVREGSPV